MPSSRQLDRRDHADETIFVDRPRSQTEAVEQLLLTARSFLAVLIRQRGLILACIAVATLLGLAYSMLKTPVYEGTTTLLMRTDKSRIVPFDDVSTGLRAQSDGIGFETEMQFLRSREVGLRVIRNLSLAEHPLFTPAASGGDADAPARNAEEVALSRYMKGITIEPIRNSRILKIMFRSTDPELAAQVANEAARSYLRAELELRTDANRNATTGLNTQLDELRNRLLESEAALTDFRERNKLTGPNDSRQQALQSQIEDLAQRRLDASVATALARERYQEAVRAGNQSGGGSLSGIAVDDARKRLDLARREVDIVTSRFGKAHPQYLSATATLQAERRSLRSEINAEINRREQELRIAERAEQALIEAQNKLSDQARLAGRFSNQLEYLQQNVDVNRQLYQTFLARAKEVGAATDVQPPSANVLDQAVAPKVPIGPSRLFILAFFAFAGGVVGLIWGYAKHYFDRSITSIEQAEGELGQRVIAALPTLPATLIKGRGKLVRSDPASAYCEAVREIAAMIEFDDSSTRPRSVSVTAAHNDVDKETLVTNLGIVLSQSGSVLIIDADMRRGNIHKLMGIRPDKPGLLDVLANHTDPTDAMHLSRTGQISVMTIGGSTLKAPSAIKLPALRKLVTEMEQCFQAVIINAPALEGSPDGLIVSGASSRTLVVVSMQSPHTARVKRALARLSRVRANVLGIILDKCPQALITGGPDRSPSTRAALVSDA